MRLILLFPLIFSMSCNVDQDIDQVFMNFDTDIYFEVKTTDGIDLLNPENPSGFEFDEIRLFYQNSEGEKVEYYDADLDYPRNIDLESPTDLGLSGDALYRLALFSVIPENQKSITMYLNWNGMVEDKVVCEIKQISSNSKLIGGGSIRIIKVWVNDELLWDVESNPNQERVFTLIK